MPRKKKAGRPKGPKKAQLNTTIEEEVLEDFRKKCNGIHMTMGQVLEGFMRDFNQGHFSVGVTKTKYEKDKEILLHYIE